MNHRRNGNFRFDSVKSNMEIYLPVTICGQPTNAFAKQGMIPGRRHQLKAPISLCRHAPVKARVLPDPFVALHGLIVISGFVVLNLTLVKHIKHFTELRLSVPANFSRYWAYDIPKIPHPVPMFGPIPLKLSPILASVRFWSSVTRC